MKQFVCDKLLPFVKTLERWWDHILNYFNQGITNGAVEGINNRVKLIKRRGYGYRNVAKAAAKALYAKHERQSTETVGKPPHRIRGEASPEAEVSTTIAIRALPEIRPYEEHELTRIIAQVCYDYSTTRRFLVMNKRSSLMTRSAGIYEFTELGKAVWRVEHFILEHYLRRGTAKD